MFSKRILSWHKNKSKAKSITINGTKIMLREKRLEDANEDYIWRVDPELAELDDTKPLKISYEQFFELYKEELKHKGIWSRRFAIVTYDGKHIGNCMYYDIDSKLAQAELGILIGNRDYWSAGYGEDAVVTLLKHIYAHTNLTRVYLHTLDWNKRAIRCFEKSGLKCVAHVERDNATFALMECYKDSWSAHIAMSESINSNKSASS